MGIIRITARRAGAFPVARIVRPPAPMAHSRARTVANYLTMQGVSGARIRSQGFGETMPVADNATEEGRRRNRRVEIKIVPISQEQVEAARQQGM